MRYRLIGSGWLLVHSLDGFLDGSHVGEKLVNVRRGDDSLESQEVERVDELKDMVDENQRLKQEFEQVRPSVQWFALQMEKKLQENDHKVHWNECGIDYLMSRMVQEYGELVAAVWDLREENGSPEAVISEAADVANFVHMIADNLREDQSKKRGY